MARRARAGRHLTAEDEARIVRLRDQMTAAELEETADVLATPGALADIREAEAAISRGDTYDEETIREDLASRGRPEPD